MCMKWSSCCLIFIFVYLTIFAHNSRATGTMEKKSFEIANSWDGIPIKHNSVNLTLYPDGDTVVLEIRAPFFNDTAPNGEAGKTFPELWNYEVVEAFFLAEDDKYLEAEFSPHGQHLLLLLDGQKNAIKIGLPVQYSSSIDGNEWSGYARIPKSYFPPKLNRFNAYAIHGIGESRCYDALFPTRPKEFSNPDFHRLEFFHPMNLQEFLKIEDSLSEVWIQAIREPV